MKGAMNSTSIPEFSRYASQLQDDAAKASKLQYKSDPETYRKGMQELQQELIPLSLMTHFSTVADQALHQNANKHCTSLIEGIIREEFRALQAESL